MRDITFSISQLVFCLEVRFSYEKNKVHIPHFKVNTWNIENNFQTFPFDSRYLIYTKNGKDRTISVISEFKILLYFGTVILEALGNI